MIQAAHNTPPAGNRQADDTLPLVRNNVKNVLTRSRAFRSLPKEKRDQIARDMVKVARYMVDAGGETRDAPVGAVVRKTSPAARTQAQDDKGEWKDPIAEKIEQRGAAFAETISKVDFPGFVGGLIDGVFNAIVKASIDQMEAYATLIQNVAKTADQYMKDNVSEDQARDWLAERYPDHLEANLDEGRLQPRADADSNMPDFMSDLGLPFPMDRLDNDNVEEQLVPAARKRIAIDRQQLLLTLVLMGINRIVVSDGRISASVVYELDLTLMAKQHLERERTFEYNSKSEGTQTSWGYQKGESSASLWYRPKTKFNREASFNLTTTQESDNEDTTKMKATMKGNVDLRFKSETFPLEKMTDMLGFNKADLEAKQARPAAQPAAPGATPPPMPPMPQT